MAKHRLVTGQSWATDEFLKQFGDQQYIVDLLTARRDFLRLRRREEVAIRRIYEMAASRVARQLRRYSTNTLTRRHLQEMERVLNAEVRTINEAVQKLTQESVTQGVQLGTRPVDNYLYRAIKEGNVGLDITVLQRGFADVNTAAVEALWARTHKGLRVSDRIWQNSQRARVALRTFIQVGTAAGRDAAQIARDLEQYVRTTARTLAKDYPNMMRRLGRRVPNDLSYEALRLVRTEKTKAYNEGTYSRGRVNPAYRGVKWKLSDAHPMVDICDTLAEQNLYGLGAGVYPPGQEPVVPHPNCLCFVLPFMEPMSELTDRLIAWRENPSSQPDIDEWYRTFYTPLHG